MVRCRLKSRDGLCGLKKDGAWWNGLIGCSRSKKVLDIGGKALPAIIEVVRTLLSKGIGSFVIIGVFIGAFIEFEVDPKDMLVGWICVFVALSFKEALCDGEAALTIDEFVEQSSLFFSFISNVKEGFWPDDKLVVREMLANGLDFGGDFSISEDFIRGQDDLLLLVKDVAATW